MTKLPSVPTALHVFVIKECYILLNTFIILVFSILNTSVFIEIPSEKERLDHATRWKDLSFLETGSHTVTHIGLELCM